MEVEALILLKYLDAVFAPRTLVPPFSPVGKQRIKLVAVILD